MTFLFSRRLVLSTAALPLFPAAARAAGAAQRITGPFTHENLSVYFIHNLSSPGPVPLTLSEAMEKGAVTVFETGNVSELSIENTGSAEVFIQAGDIVKGGKQDRVLTISLLMPPKSGKMPIASFCVEQGRWQARGREDVSRFASSNASLPSREAKLAMKAAPKPLPAPVPSGSPLAGQRIAPARQSGDASVQGQVWDSVRKAQAGLSKAVGAPVAARESATSMQLTLENEKLRASQSAYKSALLQAGAGGEDIVGFAFAVNGKINSADVYPSAGLFKKMWAKNLEASIAEALAASSESSGAPPDTTAVTAFLETAERGASSTREVSAGMKLESRDAPGHAMFETRGKQGAALHRNYLAK